MVFAPRERKDVGRVTQEPSARAIRTCLWRAGSRVVIVVQIADVNAHVVAATRHPLPRSARKCQCIDARAVPFDFV